MSQIHHIRDWHTGTLACSTREPTPRATPDMARVTCPQCRARTAPGPQRKRQAHASRTPTGATILHTGLHPLVGGRGHRMNQLEMAYYAVLLATPQVLSVAFEPFPLPLGKKVMYWCDFEVIRYASGGGIAREWHEVKRGKRTESGTIVAQYLGDGRTKWVLFCERWGHVGACKLAIGWREQGRYWWDVREERHDD